MYDPGLNDNYYEWVELYNPTNETINLSGWTITDNSEQEFLEGDFDHGNGTTTIPSKGYALITDHGTKFYENYSIPNETIRLYVDDSSIGNGLGNSGDKLVLKNETGITMDAMEWIIDYEDVPGLPASAAAENHSLSRYNNVDTDNSSADFYEAVTPTPGAENKIELKPSLNIDLYPIYIPKVQNNSLYSLPFAIKINISNYPANESYQIKSYIVGNNSSSLPASQTWNGTDWEYSNYYTSILTTDSYGNWTGWQYLRLKNDYKEYEENVIENFSACLKVKIKKDNSTNEVSKAVFLLDMDNSTSNGTMGGCTAGVAIENDTFLEGNTVIIENESGNVTGIYITEDNKIDDEFVSKPGYFKLASPVDSNYTIKILENDGTIIQTINNITVRQGNYKVDIYSPETSFFVRKNETANISLVVKNICDFNDTIELNITQVTEGWSATIDKENASLGPKENCNASLSATPCKTQGCTGGNVKIVATSENDIGESDEITISFEIRGPDLTIKDVKIYDEGDNENNTVGEGEVIKVKASLKNLGNENATNVSVMFYYDSIDENHLIGCKNYDSVGKYQKYPSIEWDTKDTRLGAHTIFVAADEENKIDELCESNNQLCTNVKIYDTSLSKIEKDVLITELYYYTHPRINNEFITIFNPSSESIDISGWYITNNPMETKTEQTKIVFPDNTKLASKTSLYITENASAYL